jgi:pSer/pThr/pTyr-binding forkhead associated (FHA) protein
MIFTVKDFVEQARQQDREAFVSANPDPFLIQRPTEKGVDPRNEYCSTLKFQFDHKTQEVRIDPTPPSPLDVVVVLKKSDRNTFAGKVLVGRTETNDVVVPHLTVSKHHAFFRFDPEAGRHTLTDTDSTNGTRLNGQTVASKQSRFLGDGDQVCFGEACFTFYSSGGFHDLLRSLSVLR